MRRTYIYDKQLKQVVEAAPLRGRNLRPAMGEELRRRDGIMSVAEGESKYIADQQMDKLVSSGEYDKMYQPVERTR